MPPPNSFPLTLSCPGAFYCSAPHRLNALRLRLDAGVVLLLDVARVRTAVRFRIAWTAIKVLLDVARGCSWTSQDPSCLESARGLLLEAVSSLPIVS
jgi:hypothetical protein